MAAARARTRDLSADDVPGDASTRCCTELRSRARRGHRATTPCSRSSRRCSADRSLVRVAEVEGPAASAPAACSDSSRRYVGVSPKWVLARYRMHDAVTALDEGYAGSLADLAAALRLVRPGALHPRVHRPGRRATGRLPATRCTGSEGDPHLPGAVDPQRAVLEPRLDAAREPRRPRGREAEPRGRLPPAEVGTAAPGRRARARRCSRSSRSGRARSDASARRRSPVLRRHRPTQDRPGAADRLPARRDRRGRGGARRRGRGASRRDVVPPDRSGTTASAARTSSGRRSR